MSRRVLVLDGLWYSLCPSFSPLALSRPNPLLKQRKPSSRPSPPPALRIAAPPRHRCYSSNASQTDVRARTKDSPAHDDGHVASPPFVESISLPNELWENEHDSFGHEATFETHDEETLSEKRKKAIKKWPGVPKYAAEKSNDSLETLLQTEMAKKPNITSATNILRLLIRDRGVKPSARHYKALILANSDALHGSPMFVRSLLEEMEKQGIAADSGTLHAALQVCHTRVEMNFLVSSGFLTLFFLARRLLYIQTSASVRKFSRNSEIDGSLSARLVGILWLRVSSASTNSKWRLSKLSSCSGRTFMFRIGCIAQ